MIDFKQKQSAPLMRRIADANLHPRFLDGVFSCADEAATQAIIDAWTLADAIAAKKKEIDVYAAENRDAAVEAAYGKASIAEMSAWAIKRAEAIAYKASGKLSDAPTLSAEAAKRGASLTAVADRVIANANALLALESHIAGIAGKHKDAVAALTDFVAIRDYDFKW